MEAGVGLVVECVVLRPRAGTHVGNCIMGAVQFAIRENVACCFEHNGRHYKVSPKDIFDSVANQHPEHPQV